MPGRSFRVARIAGIPVGVSPLWLVIVAVLSVALGSGYYQDAIPGVAPVAAYGLGLLSVLLLFASILAHEFGHALVARRCGMKVEEIDLWLLGGVARMSGRPQNAADELRYAAAGPLVTLLATLLFGALALALRGSAPLAVRALVDYEAVLNLMILCFNMIPAFPLDGGRVARALLWKARGDLVWATELAARVGSGFGWLLVVLGLLASFAGTIDGLWLLMIGAFLIMAAGAERVHEEQVQAVSGVTVASLMSLDPVCVSSEATAADALQQLERQRHDAFPVIGHDGCAVGLLTTHALEDSIRDGYATLVAEIADTDPDLRVQPSTDASALLDNGAFLRAHHAVVVDGGGRPIGIIAESDIMRGVTAGRLEGSSPGKRDLVRHG